MEKTSKYEQKCDGNCNGCPDNDNCEDAECKVEEYCYYSGSFQCPGIGYCQQ